MGKEITLHDVSAGCLANSMTVTAMLTCSVGNKKCSVYVCSMVSNMVRGSNKKCRLYLVYVFRWAPEE